MQFLQHKQDFNSKISNLKRMAFQIIRFTIGKIRPRQNFIKLDIKQD